MHNVLYIYCAVNNVPCNPLQSRVWVYTYFLLQISFKTTTQSILYLIWIQILYNGKYVYLFSNKSRKYRNFSNMIYIFMNTSIITKQPRLLSLLSEYAQILCGCPYKLLLQNPDIRPSYTSSYKYYLSKYAY